MKKTKQPEHTTNETLAKQIELLQQELTQAADFVQQIKSGNLTAEYKSPLTKHPLAKSLLLLRDQMAKLVTQEKQRNWSNEGIAKFGDLLRLGQQETLIKLFDTVLAELIDYVGASQGILSLVKDDHTSTYLEQVSCYAGHKKKKKELIRFQVGEGLAGQAVATKKEIYLTKVPRNYLTISSGLGKASPLSVLIMPLLRDTEALGVIELALFKTLEQYEIDFIKRVSQGIASAYFNMRINERTRHLLAESQQQELQLKEQEVELRKNMNQLFASREEILKIQLETEAQTKIINSLAIVSKANLRGDITYVNDEFVKWSKYSREEVMGKNHRFLKSGDQDDAIFVDLWKTISSGRVWRGEIKNKAKDGSFYWVDAIIAPVLGADGKPKEYIAQRFVINDTKERESKVSSLLIESQAKEEELRTNMQALEETQKQLNELMKETEAQTKIINSLAIVSKADVQGNITYVNDEFLKWSQYTRDEVIGQNHRLLKSGDQDDLIFVDLWRTISKGKIWRGEIKNKAKDGSFYWVDAIIAPVLGEDGKPKEYIAQRFVINDKKEREEEMALQNKIIRQASDKINKSYKELQVAQDQLVQTEKMAFLGRLTSGVAHEINTPLGAIKASSENVQVAVDNIIQHTQQLMDSIPREVVPLVFSIIHQAGNYKDTFTSAQRRATKRTVITSLQAHHIEQAESVAEYIVLLGIHDEFESWEPVLRLTNASDVLSLIYEVISVKEQNMNIGIAVSKAAKILFALKKYSHQGHEEHATEFDVVDNLETVLAIYSNNLKQVEVMKNFEPVDKIMGYPDELNQVWTNLIHNALQAMDGKGKMEFRIYPHAAGGAVVEIKDFGPGIPEENLKKIFDPFFTTKAPGEGTGLGLSIVKKIISKHEAHIECESVVGKGTTFRVVLPGQNNSNN